MKIINYPKQEQWAEICQRPHLDITQLMNTVSSVLSDVKARGDEAVKEYEERFDHVALASLAVTEAEIDEAETLVSADLKAAIKLAHENIFKFHAAQKFEGQKIETRAGVECWQKSVAIEKVGLYIPGGTAGGVQAIGAMAYGTESVPKVYKIFGPGNQYVMAAKQQVSLGEVAIDMPAGPSEVCVLADDTADASFVAADLLSQAEHGIDSQVLLVTTSETLLQQVQDEVARQLDLLPRKDIAQKALENSRCVLVSSSEEMMALSNAYAPEHLIIQTENYEEMAEQVVNAGSVFLGKYACESAGDYASGTNHTLPTHGYATAYSGVNLDSYCRKITFQHLSQECN